MSHVTPRGQRSQQLFSAILNYRLILVAFSLFLMAGCGFKPVPVDLSCSADDAASASATVFTATATSAEPTPSLPTSAITPLRRNALAGRPACAVIISPDGEMITFDLTPRRPDGSVEHGSGREKIVNQRADQFLSAFQALTASGPGLNTLQTMTTAARRHITPAHLVVVTSGISTEPPLDLRSLGWDIDAATLAQRLKDEDELPDLAGWSISLLGIGDAGGSQRQPVHRLQARLGDLYSQLCRASGARTCDVLAEMVAPEPPKARNIVPAVSFPKLVVEPGHVALSSAFFELDSSELDHDVDADLVPLVDEAIANRTQVEVVGRTDAVTGTKAHNLVLSQERAEAVRDRLIELGLPANQIRAKGVGAQGMSSKAERLDPRQIARDRRVDVTVQQPKSQKA